MKISEKTDMLNGIINVYKEKGYTSHDVVAKLRGILKQKKIGHTGTLDPDAEGVLPVCLGKGTKLCDMLTDKDKVYKAVMHLGIETDTQDMSGKVLNSVDIPSDLTSDKVLNVIMSYVGEYSQIPPMYSALKINGKKLYELAREGIEVERKPRNVMIYSIEVEDISLPLVTMTVKCSKGTYIRTLCHDIGKSLGLYGCMEQLLRTKVSRFDICDSLTLNQIEQFRNDDRLNEIIMPIDEAFVDYSKIVIREDCSKLLYNGNPFVLEQASQHGEIRNNELYRVYDYNNVFIGVYRYVDNRIFKVEKFFMDI